MSKVAFASIAALALAGTASAQLVEGPPGGSGLKVDLGGDVEETCGITAADPTLAFDYGEMTRTQGPITGGVSFGLVCNSAGGAFLNVSSANGGYLLRNGTETGPGRQIKYTFDLDKGADEFQWPLGTRPDPLFSDQSFNIPPSQAFREGREVGAYIVVWGVRGPNFQGAPTTTVFAGAYSDTITVSLTAQ